ncbi:prepilin-type N-terminal cleavage/methylation domain-containing protein [Thiobacillus sp.]|uniref:prepilin-type N-terminal cleavage/methylation domain-containing protein n=1 Tax=Thiobacillus sp. TaxID=924 RepID=UPI0025DFAC7B|nr:prepilin-type N-terminal cleavage/methylation domain-containing protein [Thiobacillus sp.]
MIKTTRGFTLIEMAIVLIIITILIGGLAVPLSAQIQARRIAETKKIMEEAREAIVGYAMSHSCSCVYDATGTLIPATPTPSPTTCTSTCPANDSSLAGVTLQHAYLPCPDTSGTTNGNEDRNFASGACEEQVVGSGLSHGYLPWVTLGVAQQDAWGNRLLYAVNTTYSHKYRGFSTSTALDDPLQICSTHSCATPDVAANVVFVLASFGPNGWGALNVNGNTLAAPTGADELENKEIPPDSTYVSRIPTQVGGPGGEFDDLLVWVSDSLLKARVCPTGSSCSP